MHRGALRNPQPVLNNILMNYLNYFLDKMVDINTWRCRIGTFNQKSKKVFHVLKCQGKKVVVSSCYFSCFVVSVNMGFNSLFFIIYLILRLIIGLLKISCIL